MFRDIVSGRRRGVLAALARASFAALELPYRWAVVRRNRRYDSGRAKVRRVNAIVISVGNITLGGTGKTPFVAWLAQWFLARGARVALVSRGYGATGQGADAQNDEARELAARLPGTPHFQNADRVAAAERANREAVATVIIADDGFQHRRLARDLDIVLVDALCPFGYGRVFPRGLLREPLAGLARAQVIALSRADLVTADERAAIRLEVERHAPRAAWIELRQAPRALINSNGAEQPVTAFDGQRVAAFCGLGAPAGFRATLDRLGYQVIAWREFPDHYAYTPTDKTDIARWAVQAGATVIVCTHKDLVKLPVDRLGETPLWALTIGVEITAGQEKLEVLLAPLAERGK